MAAMYLLGLASVAAVTKRYRLSELNNLHRESLSILEAGSLTSKCLQGLCLLRSLSLVCRQPSSPCVHTCLSHDLVSSNMDTVVLD